MKNIVKKSGFFLLRELYKKYNIKNVKFDNVDDAHDMVCRYRNNLYEEAEIINHEYSSQIDVSVIVPVYNAEKYLRKCIESILEQKTTYRMEVLLINDGSTDNSGNILKDYINWEDCLVRVIDQNNRGFSGARNRGLNEAVGKYVMFVDSDDILEETAVQVLLSEAEKTGADIVEGGFTTFPCEISNVKYKYKVVSNCNKDKLKLSGYFWNKIYRRELFENVRLPENLLFEDTLLHLIIYPLSKKMIMIEDQVYRYRINEDGITHTFASDYRGIDSYWVCKVLLELRKSMNIELDDSLYKFILYHLSVMTFSRIRMYDEEVVNSVFYLSCELVESIRPTQCQLNKSQKILETAFLTKNKNLWKVSSKFDSYENQLKEW